MQNTIFVNSKEKAAHALNINVMAKIFINLLSKVIPCISQREEEKNNLIKKFLILKCLMKCNTILYNALSFITLKLKTS